MLTIMQKITLELKNSLGSEYKSHWWLTESYISETVNEIREINQG